MEELTKFEQEFFDILQRFKIKAAEYLDCNQDDFFWACKEASTSIFVGKTYGSIYYSLIGSFPTPISILNFYLKVGEKYTIFNKFIRSYDVHKHWIIIEKDIDVSLDGIELEQYLTRKLQNKRQYLLSLRKFK